MKKAALIAMVLVCVPTGVARAADDPPWNILLVGGPGADSFQVKLSPDGRTYEINSAAPLEVGGTVCWHPGGDVLALLCDAPAIASFEVNGEDGNDIVEISPTVRVPVVLFGGAGRDTLLAGSGDDNLVGREGADHLQGGAGNDLITGGGGTDFVYGELGDDRLLGEGGPDSLNGGAGDDQLAGGLRHDALGGGPGNDRLSGGEGRDTLIGGLGEDRYIDAFRDSIVAGPGRDLEIPGGVVQ